MNVKDALAELIKAGADIEQTGEDSFLVRDNGFWGFAEYTDPFTVDGDDILEMHEMYLEGI